MDLHKLGKDFRYTCLKSCTEFLPTSLVIEKGKYFREFKKIPTQT